MKSYFAPAALLPTGWAKAVRLDEDDAGSLQAVRADATSDGAERLTGPILPGMPNLHSHAFQRAMAGLAERAGPSEDSFWTWREVMYGFVGKLTPEQVEAIAAQLYVEMLKSGFTAVAEFHYLHHGIDGRPYDNLAEMSERVIAAASESGIGLTHLPVLYGYGGFGGKAAGQGQRRFLNDPERYLKLIEKLFHLMKANPQLRLGIAPHSLRAVTAETLTAALKGLDALDPSAPIHIHIAEQTKEVDDCLSWSGERPVDWLMKRFAVSGRWCLIHATHMTEEETEALAKSGAIAGLCPTTEANLGDGFFNLMTYEKAKGAWGIGSDSHISVSPVEDLRWLEYGQRLLYRRRNLFSGGLEAPSVGAALWKAGLAGGATACGRALGALQKGSRADFIVLDDQAATLQGRGNDSLIDAFLFAGNANVVRDVFVGGQQVVKEGRHQSEEKIATRFAQTLKELSS